MAPEDDTAIQKDRCTPLPFFHTHTDTRTQHMRSRFMSRIKLHNVNTEQNYRCVIGRVEG